MPLPGRSATLALVCVPAVAFVIIVAGLITGPFSRGYVGDGTVIAIKNTHTGKYLSVSQEDGLVRVTHSSSALPETHFKVVALSATTVSLLQPAKVRRPRLSKKLCACSGFQDEHGYGGYCHPWESEHHHPWCYVDDGCEGARRGVKMRKHQACSSQTGFLGPEGWVAPPGCGCSGHESVHGFGAECRGWEFAGQTPWCYTDSESCATASGTAGTFESKHVECVRNVPPPPPMPPSSPPPMPSPPPPPSPPPAPWAENRDGWGGPSDCPCSGYNSSLGFGAHCGGWEFEGQTPWCYVASTCPAVAATGSFGHGFFTCTKKPGGLSSLMGRRLRSKDKDASVAAPGAPTKVGQDNPKKLVKEQDKAAKKEKVAKKQVAEKEPTPLSKQVEAATGKKVSSKSGSKVLADARARAGVVTATTKQVGKMQQDKVKHAAKALLPKVLPFDQEQARLRASTALRQRVALVSQATGGFLVAEPPPHKFELFLRGDEAALSQRAVFTLPAGRSGEIVALGTTALLNLCSLKPESPDELGVCTGTPTRLRKRHTARRGAGEHHRKLLLKPAKSAAWVIEVLVQRRGVWVKE